MFGGFGMGAGGWVLMTVFWIVLVTVVVWAIVRLVPSRTNDGREPRHWTHKPRPPAEAPQEILDRRLASGEIDVETYEELRSKLSSPPPVKVG
jgi:putative membrane protein